MTRDHQVTINRGAASEGVNDLIRRRFITVVRLHRDGKRTIRYAPGCVEWFEAVALYSMARNADAVTEAHRARIRAAWRAIDGRVRWSDDDRAFLREALDFQ